MDKRINYFAIEESFGCDNCEHDIDGYGLEYCEGCDNDCCPPGNYQPARNSIQEKIYYEKYDSITYEDYLRFCKTGK